MATWVGYTTTSSGGNISMRISGGYGSVSHSGNTVSFSYGVRFQQASSTWTSNSIAAFVGGTRYYAKNSSQSSSGTWYYAYHNTSPGKTQTGEVTPFSYSGNVGHAGSGSVEISVGTGWDGWTPSNKYTYKFSVPYGAASWSYNMNILNPDGSEPYTTGEAGSVEESINGGSYSRVYNEAASSYANGTTFTYRNFTPGTGRHLSSVSGISPNNTTGPWSLTLNAAASVNFQTAWNTYTVSYNANGGSGAPGNQTKTYGTALTLSSTKPTRSNSTATGYTVTFNGNGGTPSKTSQAATNTTSYTFNNWKATNGTTYAAGASYTANEGTTMTAQWNSSTTKGAITTATASRSNGTATRTVTFNANGGTTSKTSQNSTATITYSCTGWFTATSGGTKRAASGGSYTPSASETVYAQWSSTTGSYGAVTLPTTAQCTRSGYKLLGFATSSTATTAAYSPGASYTPSAAITLYAVWELEQAQLYTKKDGAWKKGPAYVKVNGSWVMAKQVYTKVNGAWVLNK